jgi:hypothetical protein
MLAYNLRCGLKESQNKLIPIMVRQAHHERNQQLTVRPELVEGLCQRFLKYPLMTIGMLLLCIPFVTVVAANAPETMAEYVALKGQSFTVSRMGKSPDTWSKAVDLKLVEISEPVKDSKTEQFVVRFQAALKDKALHKAVHRFEHAATGPFTLFLEPAGNDKKYRYYQAIFNLLK